MDPVHIQVHILRDDQTTFCQSLTSTSFFKPTRVLCRGILHVCPSVSFDSLKFEVFLCSINEALPRPELTNLVNKLSLMILSTKRRFCGMFEF